MPTEQEYRLRYNMTLEERVAVLENMIADNKEETKMANQKLDQLLSMRDKGLGAFWLASTLFGTGIVGTLYLLVQWLVGKH